jgi:hypothetical protein
MGILFLNSLTCGLYEISKAQVMLKKGLHIVEIIYFHGSWQAGLLGIYRKADQIDSKNTLSEKIANI